jgi:adenylate cyclase
VSGTLLAVNTADWLRSRADNRNRLLRSRLDAIGGTRDVPTRDDVVVGSARETRGVVLFVDLVKSTQLSIRYAGTPEKMLATLNLLVPTLMDAARCYGGEFEKNTGDGVLAYFGMGSSIDDAAAAAKAVASAYAMLWATRHVVNPLLRGRGLFEVSVTVGADIGDVLLARIGLQRIENGTPLVAVGVAANRAAKIQGKPQPNQARIGEDLHRTLPREWKTHFQPVPPGTPWPFEVPRSIAEIQLDEVSAVAEARQRDEVESQRWRGLGLPSFLYPGVPREVSKTRPYRVYALKDGLR